MAKRSSKRRRSNDTDPRTEEGNGDGIGQVGTGTIDSSKLSPLLSQLHPELQLLMTKLGDRKPMKNEELRKLLGLLISELHLHLPAVQQSIKRIAELEKENETLVADKSVLLDQKDTIRKENVSLKEDILKNNPPAILIKNLPLHHEFDGIKESYQQSHHQVSKLLTLMQIPKLKFKSVYRWPTRPGTTSSTHPTMKITFFDVAAKKVFLKKLFMLKTSELRSIRAQPFYPRFLKEELKKQERLAYMIRQEMKIRTRIILENGKLIIQILREGFWITYDLLHPEQNQPVIFNSICPKIL